MHPQRQHVILKKLNKEKFLASRENDIVSGLTQIVSGLNVRGAICWFVANFVKIVWQFYMFVKNMFSDQTWEGDDVTCLSFFLRILKFSANSKLVKNRFSTPDSRGWWCNMSLIFSQNSAIFSNPKFVKKRFSA